MKKSLIITGASGFVGANFIKNSPEYFIKEVDLIEQNISTIDFSGYTSVLHLAAIVHQMKSAPEEEYFKINCDLAFDVAIHAKEQGVKHFIFMSTVKVFGEFTLLEEPMNELSKCYPLDAYGKSKYKAEKLIQSLESENFKVAIIRSPLVYGSSVKANMLNLIKLVDKFSFLPFGKIQNKRSMVYVGNLVALIKIIINKEASGIFIAGDNVSLSTTRLVELIGKCLNKRVFLFRLPQIVRFTLKYFKPNYFSRLYGSFEFDNSKTNKSLDFTPPFSVEDGILDMVEWYKTKDANKNAI
jgi:UDP-glucose 4-epimerase